MDWEDVHRWRLIAQALEIEQVEPVETYSASPHLYEDLDIPEGVKGRLPKAQRTRAGLDAEAQEELGGPDSQQRGRGGQRNRGRSQQGERGGRGAKGGSGRGRQRQRRGGSSDAKQENQERSQKPRRQRSRTRRRDGEVVQRDSSGDN